LDYSRGVSAWSILQTQHWRFVLGILGAGLIVCAFVPALRPAAIGTALLSKLAFLGLALAGGLDAVAAAGLMHGVWLEAAMVVALLAAGAILAGQAWQEARWNGMLRCPWRSDARSAG
jgi:peptidoglycan/LPS O-acetylase OafA/YrhL